MSEIVIKILLIGDSYVGKTSLLLKYTEGNCPLNHMATIGVEFKEKKIEINNKVYNLQIWDTSGQERFRSITKNFYRNADGIIFVFDVTKPKTFGNIKNWLIESEDAETHFKKILVGNKIDLVNERVIDKEKMESFGEKKNMKCFETSAIKGENVDLIFKEIAELILQNKTEQQIKEEFTQKNRSLSSFSKESELAEVKKKGCC